MTDNDKFWHGEKPLAAALHPDFSFSTFEADLGEPKKALPSPELWGGGEPGEANPRLGPSYSRDALKETYTADEIRIARLAIAILDVRNGRQLVAALSGPGVQPRIRLSEQEIALVQSLFPNPQPSLDNTPQTDHPSPSSPLK